MFARSLSNSINYQLREEDIPSKNSLEDLADQLESGDWRAMSLKEIASRADQESDAQLGSLTVGKLGQVKMKKSAVETPAPKDQEEFRQKLKLFGHHFVFLRMLHPTRKELEGVNPSTFSTYTDYMCCSSGSLVRRPKMKRVRCITHPHCGRC